MGTHARPDDIDTLYGLEPVIVPGEEAGADRLEPFVDIECPWCGEAISLQLDLTAGSQSYVEDCQVCCAPIDLAVRVDADGNLQGVDAGRADR